ncbi:hypothetical protein [Kutzneria kofuensis]|uniref:Uncharacterized protein n=1 Tax=Kutzneria kofuensis TaxID=103725 RepID=A0A7W9KMG7_9PSEU|nr:hypothetical protein [Kutzneria kofuensis]MBB5895275.1 hypothetical protein [Kutzneria kofuensis]
MAARVRRSAGTNTYLNMLLFRRSRPELDLENYRNGDTFKVASLLRKFSVIGNPGTLRNGFLHLGQGQPVAWHSRSGMLLLAGPFELNEIGGKVPLGRNFTRCLLSTSKNDYELAVPTSDMPLVRLALASAADTPVQAPAAAAPDPGQPSRKFLRTAANLAMLFLFFGIFGMSARQPLAVGWTVALTFVWVCLVSMQAARVDRSRLRGMIFRDPRAIRDTLISVMYIAGLLLMPWVPSYVSNFWALGIVAWLIIALVTFVVRYVQRTRPSAA